MLKVTDLYYNINNKQVLQDINFHVFPGEFVFLVGPSGAGKTTLLKLLHGSLRVQRGGIELSGLKIKGLWPWKLLALRRKTGYVFQDFKLLENCTVQQNIALPLLVQGVAKPLIDERLQVIIKSMHLNGLLHVKCKYLSGGEKQRVAIARALIGQPKLILADEPTGNLDSGLALRIMNIFEFLNKHGLTIILATHNINLIPHIQNARILYITNGSLGRQN